MATASDCTTTFPMSEITKHVHYDRESRDFAATVVVAGTEEYLGSFATLAAAELACDEHAYGLLACQLLPTTASASRR